MSNISLGQEMQTLDVGRGQTITGVRVYAGQNDNGDDLTYMAGTTSGTVLEVKIPNGTQATASTILDGLSKRGYTYRPYNSDTTYTDPAIEIGDSVDANGNVSVVLSKDMTHSRLMASNLSAPYDEEVDHEFKWEARSSREYRRETKYTRSRLSINSEAITAEVERATSQEGELRATLSVQADQINAKVSKNGGSASSFGWTLTDASWELFSGSKTVLKATSDGIAVNGQITATSGYIGTESAGFIIGSRSLRNGMDSYSDTENDGVYVGTNGIALGGGKFKVSSSGALTATNATITGGSITIRDASDNVAFRVTSTGALTATNATITGGSITIRDNNNNIAFQVTSTGHLTATSGTFSGTVSAKNVLSGTVDGVNHGTFGGGGITPGTINTGQGGQLDSSGVGGISGGINFNGMDNGTRPAYVYASAVACSGEVSGSHWYGKIMDANESTHSTMWQSKTAVSSVSGSFNGNNWYWFEATNGSDYLLPTSFGASASATGTVTINHLGY